MAEPPKPDPDPPPLVLRADPDPAPPPAPPRRPRPGLAEAVLWCLLFLGVQLLGLVAVAVVVLGVEALRADDPAAFFVAQLKGFAAVADARTAAADRPPAPDASARALGWGMLGAQVLSVGLILVVVPKRVGPDWKRQLGVRAPNPLLLVLALTAAPAFMILPTPIAEAMTRVLGNWSVVDTSLVGKVFHEMFGGWPWWLTVLAVGVGPGVVEEFWCRGFLGRGLVARYGFVRGVLLTSVLFGLLHLDPQHARIAAVMGAYLHFLYFATRSIWVPVLVHAANNGVGVLMEFGRLPAPDLDHSPLAPVVYLVCGCLIVFAGVALWTGRAKLKPATVRDATWRAEYPGVSAPPPDADAVLGYDPPSPAAVVFTGLSFVVLVVLLTR